MSKTVKLTFSAIMAALATVFMLLSYFPYLTYALPALSGLFIMVVLIETDYKWSMLSYLASAVLVFLFAEIESKLLYIFFFGYYPILKALIDGLKKPIAEWIFKLLAFNIAVVSVFLLFSKAFDLSVEEFGILGQYGALIFLGLGNIVFVLYDIAVSRMASVYLIMLHPKIKRFFKK